jgi:hypothetical protein
MEAHPARTLEMEGTEAGAGAMLVACRLAGLSALGAHYAGVSARKWDWLDALAAQCSALAAAGQSRPGRPSTALSESAWKGS